VRSIVVGILVLCFIMTLWGTEVWVDGRHPDRADVAFLIMMICAVAIVAVAAFLHFGRFL
jgi:hypothetical protein